MNKKRINKKNNLGYLHALFCDVRNSRMRMGNVDKDDEQLNPFQKKNSSLQITYKKLSKDTMDKKSSADQCKRKIQEVRKIAELLLLQSDSRWNDSDPAFYILSTKWLSKLKDYICYDYVIDQINNSIKNKTPCMISVNRLLNSSNRHPGPINNTDILMNENDFFPDWNDPTSYLNTPLRRNIGKGEFIIINKYLWAYLKSEYGLYYSTLEVTGALNICQEEEYERQEIRRFTYFTADRKNIRRVHLPMIKVFIARRGKKLEDTSKFLILKQRAKWNDVKKHIVKIIPSCLNLDPKQSMRLWIMNTKHTSLSDFTNYYNSSILRGDITDDFTIPAYCLEGEGRKLVEHTVKTDDPNEIATVILEIKYPTDYIWQFKQNSLQGKIRAINTGKEISKEYMIHENSDSDSEEEKQNLSNKYAEGNSKTVHGDFKLYFQHTFCTKEFYDIESIDHGIFQIVEEMEANKLRKIQESKERRRRMAELAKKKKEEESEQTDQDMTVDTNQFEDSSMEMMRALNKGKNIACAYCCKADSGKSMLWCKDCKEVFYCDSECMKLDIRLHNKICTRKYADEGFALETDNLQLSHEEKYKHEDENEVYNDQTLNKNADPEVISDSEGAETTKSSPKKSIKIEVKTKNEIKEESSQEELIQEKVEDISEHIHLRNIEEDDELARANQHESQNSNNLNEILDLEKDSIESNNSQENLDNEPEDDFFKDNEDVKALLMDAKSADEDLSESSDSDEDNKKDPCFKELIEIDCFSQNSHDIEDYETLNILIKDIDKLSMNSSDIEDDEQFEEIEDDIKEEEEEEKGKKQSKTKKRARADKDKESKGVRFIPLPESEAKKLKRRALKQKNKELEEKRKQIEIETFHAGYSAKALENEAMIKFIKEIYNNPEDSEYTKEVIKGKQSENEGILRKLRDADRFEDIISHLAQLHPPIFAGEYKKTKACGLCKFKDINDEIGFYLCGFPLSFKKEGAQLRVLYIQLEDEQNRKISVVGDTLYNDYHKIDIPLNPGAYSFSDIKNTIIATQKGFDVRSKDLVLADLKMNVHMNSLITNEDITFELREGDKSGIFAYEIDKKQKSIEIKDFIHIMSYEETLKTYPRFVGIDFNQQSRKLNMKIFSAIRTLLIQTFDKSIIRKYEKLGNSIEDAYKAYMDLEPNDFRFKLKVQYKQDSNIIKTLRHLKMEREGFTMDRDAKMESEKGLRERVTDFTYYKQELKLKYDNKTEEEINRMLFSIDIDLEDDPYSKVTDLLPHTNMVEMIYLIMPPASDFSDLLDNYTSKVYPQAGTEDKIYRFTENSIDMMIRKVTEKCGKCKKNVTQCHFVSETVSLPKYLIMYASKGEEKRIVMPDRIRPFRDRSLYELKGFIVYEEKDRTRASSELIAYLRKDRSTWVKIFNSRKELEYTTELKLKSGSILPKEDIDSNSKDPSSEKICGGFKVNYEDQFLTKYLYKALVYKLIGR